MRRFSWLLEVRWTRRRVAALAVGLGCLVAVGIASCTPGPVCAQVTPAKPDVEVAPFSFDPVARASAFLQALANEDFRTAYEMSANESLPGDSLCSLELETDDASLALVGLDVLPKSVDRQHDTADPSVSLTFAPALDVLDVGFQLEGEASADLHVTVSLLRDGRVYAFEVDEAVRELGPVQGYPPPPYVDMEAFEETEVVIGEAPWELGATLTMPEGPGPSPILVLVPGPDASDRDGTERGNKMFRDLAWGLATQGIATLRYDKRTWAHALAFARQPEFTLDDELVDDALAALAVARLTPRIDPARVYVLGVSLGGFVAPRIAQRDPGIAGLILVSAPSGSYVRRMAQVYQDIAEADGVVKASEQLTIDEYQARVRNIEALAAGETAELDMLTRSAYFLDLASYRPEEFVLGLQPSLLFVYGDFGPQIVQSDILGWARSLQGRLEAGYRLYRDHNQLLFAVHEMTGPTLRRRGYVGQAVVGDIAAWIGDGWPTEGCPDIEAMYAGCRM